MRVYHIGSEEFASENEGETIIWRQVEGSDVEITDLVHNFDLLQQFIEAEQDTEGDDHSDEIYESSVGK